MAALTLRTLTRAGDTTKGSPLTNAEVDTNFINLDADLDLKANLASPTFTGTPVAPTAGAGTNTTQIATTAFVKTATDNLLVSPAFTGTPTAPTATSGTNTTQIATTAFVQSAVTAGGSINNGSLTLSIGTAGLSGSSVTIETGTGFTANSSSNVTYAVSVGPALSALATVMTGAGSGYLRKSAADSYTVSSTVAAADLTGTISGDRGVTAGSTSSSFIEYNGTTKTAGQLYGGTTAPDSTTRLNYDGYFYATRFYGDGSQLTGISAGATITDDTTTNGTRYLLFDDVTSGTATSVGVSSSKLYFNPSTGTLSSTVFNSLSDETLKDNITTANDNITLALRGVEFTWKNTGIKSSGLIAQEVEAVAPHLVTINNDGVRSINYNGVIGYLVETIKQLNNRVEALENRG